MDELYDRVECEEPGWRCCVLALCLVVGCAAAGGACGLLEAGHYLAGAMLGVCAAGWPLMGWSVVRGYCEHWSPWGGYGDE